MIRITCVLLALMLILPATAARSADNPLIGTWKLKSYVREVVPTDEERITLFGTMIFYAGTYTFDAEKVIHHVDISWNQSWTGTDQVRFYKLDGNTLTITTPLNKNFVDGREGRSILVWERLGP